MASRRVTDCASEGHFRGWTIERRRKRVASDDDDGCRNSLRVQLPFMRRPDRRLRGSLFRESRIPPHGSPGARNAAASLFSTIHFAAHLAALFVCHVLFIQRRHTSHAMNRMRARYIRLSATFDFGLPEFASITVDLQVQSLQRAEYGVEPFRNTVNTHKTIPHNELLLFANLLSSIAANYEFTFRHVIGLSWKVGLFLN